MILWHNLKTGEALTGLSFNTRHQYYSHVSRSEYEEVAVDNEQDKKKKRKVNSEVVLLFLPKTVIIFCSTGFFRACVGPTARLLSAFNGRHS